MRQIVDPSAGLGDRDQERLAAASFDRRVVRGHMDDALDRVMDTILVVNAGSSSVKFQVFGVDTARKLTRKVKGQLDGIGTRPHPRASGPDGKPFVDRTYDAAGVSTVPEHNSRE